MHALRDFRYGLRVLVRNPTFAFAALTVVALGVGSTTAVFSVVRAVLLQELPYRDPDRLVLFRADGPGIVRQALVTGHELAAIRTRPDIFETVAVINESPASLTMPGEMEPITAASPSENLLEALGMAPLLGRMVTRADIGKPWVTAVDVSYELWQRHWHGDPGIVGKAIEVNNIPVTVVGVMPPGFKLYLGPNVPVTPSLDVFFPRAAGYDEGPTRSQTVIARLRRGVTLDAAQAALDALTARVTAERPGNYRTGQVRLSISTLDREVGSDARPALLALSGAVVFVLLVACANLMNLLLARACVRTRELAVRTAIGASRRRLVAQLATESLMLGIAGAGFGVLVAQWAIHGLVYLAPATLPRRDQIGIDAAVALFAVGTSVLCSVVVGLVPVWQATRTNVVDMMKQDPFASRHAGRTRGLLIASELALSLVLLAGAGLMMRAFIKMRSVPLGFEPSRAVTMQIHLQGQRFNVFKAPGSLDIDLEASKLRRLAFYHQLSGDARQIAGVEQVGIGLYVPMSGEPGPITFRVGLTEQSPEIPAIGGIALAGFLETLRVPLLEGRYFSADDDNRPVAIVDALMAGQLWPRESAVGRRLLVKRTTGPSTAVDVVGVIPHMQLDGLGNRTQPEIWVTYGVRQYADLNIVVRAANPTAVVPAVEAAVMRLGPGRPVHNIRTVSDYVADASADTRFALFVLGAFAALALVLTAIGVYGIVAYAAARRMREIAVRLALGADARRIMGLVLREGAAWSLTGLGAGLLGALALSRYLSALLFGVGARDPLTLATVVALLAGVAILASALPALRAVRTDPMVALRSE
jgi:putative ABC transport system permease protein